MQGTPKVMDIKCVLVADSKSKAFCFPIHIAKLSHDLDVSTLAFLNSGAGINCLDYQFAKKHQFPLTRLKQSIPVQNIDLSLNKGREIKSTTALFIQTKGIVHKVFFHVINCGRESLILGMLW